MKNKLIVSQLIQHYNGFKVLDKISFTVNEGEFVSIVGPSGCGKTTLLHSINSFIKKTSGTVKISGKTGFVFQDHCLFPWKTVTENIEIGPINSGYSKVTAKKISLTLLKELSLEKFENHYPHQISEGMKQRVGIARCLANNPNILFMDEPFGSLDYFTKIKMHELLANLKKKNNLTIVFVTHDVDEAVKLSDRIIVLSNRPAKILGVIQNDKDAKKRILDLINPNFDR